MLSLRHAKEIITDMVHSECSWVSVDCYLIPMSLSIRVRLSSGEHAVMIDVSEKDLYTSSTNDSVDRMMEAAKALPSGLDLVTHD